MTKFFKTLKIFLFIGAGLLLGNYLLLLFFTLIDAIRFLLSSNYFLMADIVLLFHRLHDYSLLFAIIFVLTAIAIIITEKRIKKANNPTKEEIQTKILKTVKIMLFIVGGLFLVYSFFDALWVIIHYITIPILHANLINEDFIECLVSCFFKLSVPASCVQSSLLSCVGLLLIILGFFTGIRKKKAVSSIEQPIQTEENA